MRGAFLRATDMILSQSKAEFNSLSICTVKIGFYMVKMMIYMRKTGSHRVTKHNIPTSTGHKRVIGRSDRSLDKTIARYGSYFQLPQSQKTMTCKGKTEKYANILKNHWKNGFEFFNDKLVFDDKSSFSGSSGPLDSIELRGRSISSYDLI